jgi:hypothetical protein
VKKIILAVLATAFVSAQAYAFTGTISFSGNLVQGTTKGVTTNHFIQTATNHWTTNAGNTDAYAGVPAGITTTMTNFSFTGNNGAPGTQVLVGGPVTPQWTFTLGGVTYSFDLVELTSAFSTPGSIAEAGVGTAHIGTETSNATWSLDGTGTHFNFSATIHTTATPDGGSAVALLGIALAGIEGVRRVIRARKA